MAIIDNLNWRALAPHDIAGAVALNAEAGWNQTAADWQFMLEQGEGTGVSGEALLATSMLLPHGGRFAWIAMILVTAEWQRKLALRQQRIERALAGFAGQVAHVDFDRLNADWEAEIGHVYAALDMPLSGAALAAMRREQRKAAAGSHTAHKVQIENFAAGEAA